MPWWGWEQTLHWGRLSLRVGGSVGSAPRSRSAGKSRGLRPSLGSGVNSPRGPGSTGTGPRPPAGGVATTRGWPMAARQREGGRAPPASGAGCVLERVGGSGGSRGPAQAIKCCPAPAAGCVRWGWSGRCGGLVADRHRGEGRAGCRVARRGREPGPGPGAGGGAGSARRAPSPHVRPAARAAPGPPEARRAREQPFPAAREGQAGAREAAARGRRAVGAGLCPARVGGGTRPRGDELWASGRCGGAWEPGPLGSSLRGCPPGRWQRVPAGLAELRARSHVWLPAPGVGWVG